MTTRLSTKGQLILPKELREKLGWQAGAEIEVEQQGGRVVLSLAGDEFPPTNIRQLLGRASYKGPRLSIEEMNAGILRTARESR